MMQAVFERHLTNSARVDVWVFATMMEPKPLQQAILQKSAFNCWLAGCHRAKVTAVCQL